MFGLDTLNVLVGLVTVYLAFGVACTAVVEAINAWLSVRSVTLRAALSVLLAGQLNQTTPFVQAFYAHPLVRAMTKGARGKPSYIPPDVVGHVVEDLILANSRGGSLVQAIDALPGTPATNHVKGLLTSLLAEAQGDAAAFRKGMEKHFDAVMDRAAGWFKRYAHNVSLAVAAALVIGANVDTVALAGSLAAGSAARAKMAEIAERQIAASPALAPEAGGQPQAGPAGNTAVDQATRQSDAAQMALDRAISTMEAAGLPLGWKATPRTVGAWLAKVAGLLVSIFAVSLGAPFWFDLLQGFMQVRTSGISPREKV